MILFSNDDNNNARLHWKEWAQLIDDAYAMGWRGGHVFTFRAAWNILRAAERGVQLPGMLPTISTPAAVDLAEALEAAARFRSESLSVHEVVSLFRHGYADVRIEPENVKNTDVNGTGPLGPYDYDRLHRCPFCGQEKCGHRVAAFKFGEWIPGVEPLFYWDGIEFYQKRLEAAVKGNEHVVCQEKPGRWSHPRVKIYFADNPELAQQLKNTFRRPQVEAECDDCGLTSAVNHERYGLVCVQCQKQAQSAESDN